MSFFDSSLAALILKSQKVDTEVLAARTNAMRSHDGDDGQPNTASHRAPHTTTLGAEGCTGGGRYAASGSPRARGLLRGVEVKVGERICSG